MSDIKKRVLIIEPHGDDSLISCYRILRSDAQVKVLTLSERSSERLSEHFKFVESEFLDLQDYNYDNRPADHVQVNRWHKEGKNTYQEYVNLLHEKDGFEEIVVSPLIDVVKEELLKNVYDIILVPLGVVHPYHIAVREACERIQESLRHAGLGYISDKFVYYSEGPYNGKKYGKLLEEDAISQLNLLSLDVFSEEGFIKHKEKVFKDVYPTEVKLFRFTYDEVVCNGELYTGSKSAIREVESLMTGWMRTYPPEEQGGMLE